MTTFIRVFGEPVESKATSLKEAVATVATTGRLSDPSVRDRVFDRDPSEFSSLPGSTFSYWVPSEVRELFRRLQPFEGQGRTAKQGLATADDFRFVRAWWEVSERNIGARWFGFAKGGAFSPIYSDVLLLVGYSRADQVGLQAIGRYGRGASHYFRPGLTWPRRTQGGLGLRILPRGCIFADKGPATFVDGDASESLLALLAITTSSIFRFLVELQMAFGSYEVGVIQRTPVPTLTAADQALLARDVFRAWSLKRSIDASIETSHMFLRPSEADGMAAARELDAVLREVAEVQRDIDDRVFGLYGLAPECRQTVERLSSADNAGVVVNTASDDQSRSETEEEDDRIDIPLLPFYSWLVGVAFGRFDKRLATGERQIPSEPEPFDPLPTRSPGMWPEGDERPAPPEILVDDPGHERDIVAHVVKAAAGTGVEVGEDVRAWLAREFFPLHIRMYSKSRRKAPIYWQLATASAGYSVWIYIHAFTRDTLYRVNELVEHKVAFEERRLGEMTTDGTTAERRQRAAQEEFVEELRAMRDEVARMAPLWNPELDDGVIINFAPLWRLVPQNRAWQKECKACWDRLVEGEYDWAHLAMHLWPERVVPKCAEDRSLAIAHGLEEVFWVEEEGKWKPRKVDRATIDRLVRERTSPAVKAALESLLAASAAPARARKPRAAGGRKRRATGAGRKKEEAR